MLKGKQILITGGAGFIGTCLALRLVEENQIVILDTLHRNSIKDTSIGNHPNLKFVKGDVRDPGVVKEALKGATHVVHLASIAGVDTVMKNPLLTMDVCIKGTFNLLEAAVEAGSIERFVDFSTSEVFGRYAFRVAEGDVTSLGAVGEARWTYAVSKLATEHLCHVMYQTKQLPVATVRPFNVFGPGQVGAGAIHHFVVKAIQNEALKVHNDGDQIRAWCYIDDLIDGLLLIMIRPEAVGKIFNIGNPQTAVTVYHLARLIIRLAKSKSELVQIPWPYPDVEIRIPDISRAKEKLGFQPKFDLEAGLKNTIDWYQKKSKMIAGT